MSAEYDTLYTLLQNAIQKNKSVSDTLSNIIIDIPNDAESVKRGRGRPPGSRNKEKVECQACLKKFQTDKIEEHYDTSIACKKFNALPEKPPALEIPIHQLIINAMDQATCIGVRCAFCEMEITDMKKHMTESYVCNRMAYSAFKVLI
jgi:hypothetical protein